MKQVQFFNEVSIKQRKQISDLKSKCTKAKLKNCDNGTNKELLIIIDENLLIKMKLLEEQNNELASKLEATESNPKDPKFDESNEIIKKDASTSCNDLFELDSPMCN